MTGTVPRLWGRPRGERRSSPESSDVAWDHRLEKLEARIEHLEAELEGLQDAVYRQAVREDKNMGELRRRTEGQVPRGLTRDPGRRGL